MRMRARIAKNKLCQSPQTAKRPAKCTTIPARVGVHRQNYAANHRVRYTSLQSRYNGPRVATMALGGIWTPQATYPRAGVLKEMFDRTFRAHCLLFIGFPDRHADLLDRTLILA